MIPLLIGFLLVAALLLLWRSYAPLRAGAAPRPVTSLLFILRAALVAGLVLLLAYPTYRRTEELQRPPQLTVLIDDSLSMGLPAALDSAQPRVQRLAEALDGADGAVARLRRRGWRVELRTLSSLRPVAGAGEVSPAAEVTDIAGAFTRLAALPEDTRPAAVWLCSDGAVTAGGVPDSAARNLGNSISTVGVGQESASRDVRVVDLVLPPRVFRGERVPVSAILAREAYAPPEVEAALFVNENEIARSAVEIGEEMQAIWQPDEPLVFDSTGAHTIRVTLTASTEGDAPDNNRIERLCLVEAERLRVLVLYGPLSPELGGFRRPLLSDERVEVTTALFGPGAPWRTLPAYRAPGRDEVRLVPPRLPVQASWSDIRDALPRFDLVVVGNLGAPLFSAPEMRRAMQAYVENGGALLWLGGERAFSPAGGMPPDWQPLFPLAFRRGGPFLPQGAAVRLTPQGKTSPLLAGLRDLEEAHLPPLGGLNVFQEVGAGGQLLAVGESSDGAAYPLIAVRPLGLGRVALVASNRFWLWGLQAATADDPLAGQRVLKGFWRALVHNLCGETGGPEGRVHVAAGRVFTGEAVRVWASLGYEPTLDALPESVELVVFTPDGGRERLALGLTERETNLYTGTYEPVSAGAYRVALLDSDETGGASATAEFVAEARRIEYLAPYRDSDVLQRLADATGGQAVDVAQVNTLAGQPLPPPRIEQRTRDLFLAAHPGVLGLILTLLVAGWLVRRHHQLS